MDFSCFHSKHWFSRLLKLSLFLVFFLPQPANATETASLKDYLSFSLKDLLNIELTTASHTPLSLQDSPYTVSVITDEQIRNSGARDIFDLLRHIPGIQIATTNRGRPVISMRGITRPTTDYILFLLNGHPLNEPANGSATFHFGLAHVPVHNIKRIEVVRGTGSAVYGADAFLGMVNIITYSADDLAGSEFTLRHQQEPAGNIGQEYNWLYGGQLGEGSSLSLNLNIADREGDQRFIEQDLLSNPGYADTRFEQYDAQGTFKTGKLLVSGRLTHQDRGEFTGALYIPDDRSWAEFDAGYIDVEYDTDMAQNTEANFRFYTDLIQGTSRLIGTPPFTAFTAISDLSMDVTKAGTEARFTYNGLQNHKLTMGAHIEYQSQDNLRHMSNAFLDEGDPLEDVTAINPFGKDASRTLNALYVEDGWEVSDVINVNAGLRFDDYSDFGSSLNPRLGMKWDFIDNWGLRVTYGTAFRAPDFRSLFLISPSADGNPGLHEEKIKTFELGLSGNPVEQLRVDVTLFDNELESMIAVENGVFQNIEQMKSTGMEIDLHYEQDNSTYISSNYTYLDAQKEGLSQENIPQHNISFMASTRLFTHLDLAFNLYWQDETAREDGDSRESLDGYTLVDANIQYRGFSQDITLDFSILNLFDEQYAYPSPQAPLTIINDYPAEGRSFMLAIKIRL